MTIAIDARFIEKEFIYECCSRIAKQQPSHSFLFISDKAFDATIQFPSNVHTIVKGPAVTNKLMWLYWYKFSFPAVARKHNADVILCPAGFCALGSKLPQSLVIHDLTSSHTNKTLRNLFDRYSPKFIVNAKSIATVFELTKQDILKHYNIEPEKIDVVYSASSEDFIPMQEDERARVKDKYSEGNEYFLCFLSNHRSITLINLLKAFSIFKKRQKSGMKMIFAGNPTAESDEFIKSLPSYKYREDVVQIENPKHEEFTKLTASAYAIVYPLIREGYALAPLEAMSAGTPMITTSGAAMEEICKNVALYVNPQFPLDIAEQMMLLFKDEKLRDSLIAKGLERSKNFDWDRTADLLWKSICKAAGREI